MPLFARRTTIDTATSPRWEMGSFFPWGIPNEVMLTQGSRLWGRDEEDYFVSSGRSALTVIARMSGKRWLIPEYYCPEVTAHLRDHCGVTVTTYPALPTDSTPRRVNTSGHDVLLQANLFGRWNPPSLVGQATIVHDHTHSDLSAMLTTPSDDYDFSFSSFRKTLPVPDGAWLRVSRQILGRRGTPTVEEPMTASASKLSAMMTKAIYMSTGQPRLKSCYLRAASDHETKLPGTGVTSASLETKYILEQIDVERVSALRRENFRIARSLLHSLDLNRLMQIDYAPGETPFSLVLTFADRSERDHVRSRLIANHVYPAILWDFCGSDSELSSQTVSFAVRSLSLPLDFRYGQSDFLRAISLLEQALCEA